jgi:flagellar protein FliO/FliZ
MQDINDILKIVLFVIGFLAILFLTYVTTRYIGQKQIRTMKSKNISILETVMLGVDKRLHLVKAGNSYVLIASTSKSIEFLTAVDMDKAEVNDETATDMDGHFDFRTILEKYSGMYKAKKQKPALSGEEDTSSGQQGGVGFKTNLERLKTIVNKNNKVKNDGVEVTNDK